MLTVDELRALLRSAWGPDTCYPNASNEWRPDNPARDQCGMTALVVQDLLGGDLVLGEVHVDGTKVGNHYWNRLPGGAEVDLTAEQFLPGEVIVNGQVVARPPDAPRRHREQYELLRDRVLRGLANATAQSGHSDTPSTGGRNTHGLATYDQERTPEIRPRARSGAGPEWSVLPRRVRVMNDRGAHSVTLRPVHESDLDALFAQMSDPESVRMAAFTPEDPDDRQRFDAHMARVLASPDSTNRAVIWKGDLVGSIASFVVEGQTEVTYWIDRAVWGRGIASQALASLLEVVRTRPIYARAASDNAGSLRVLEKAGFRVIGTEVAFAPARGAEIEETILQLG